MLRPKRQPIWESLVSNQQKGNSRKGDSGNPHSTASPAGRSPVARPGETVRRVAVAATAWTIPGLSTKRMAQSMQDTPNTGPKSALPSTQTGVGRGVRRPVREPCVMIPAKPVMPQTVKQEGHRRTAYQPLVCGGQLVDLPSGLLQQDKRFFGEVETDRLEAGTENREDLHRRRRPVGRGSGRVPERVRKRHRPESCPRKAFPPRKEPHPARSSRWRWRRRRPHIQGSED